MRSKLALLAPVFLVTFLPSQAVWGAQSVTTQNGVVIIRGNTDTADTEGSRVTRERGVTVFRGSTEPFPPEESVPDDTLRRIIKSGKNLWIYDKETKKVTACHLKKTIYGEHVVDCTTNSAFGN